MAPVSLHAPCQYLVPMLPQRISCHLDDVFKWLYRHLHVQGSFTSSVHGSLQHSSYAWQYVGTMVSTSALQRLQMSLHGWARVSNRVTQHTFTGNFDDFTAQMILSSVCQAHAFGNFVMPGCRGVSCGPIAQVIPLTIFSHLATTQSVNCTDRLREEDQRRPGPGQPNRSMQGGTYTLRH